MHVRPGLVQLLAVLAVLGGCTTESLPTPPSTSATTAATIDLDVPPQANLDLGSGTLVVAAAGDGLPGKVSSSTGMGTEVTIHVRCLGDTRITLIEDQGMPDDTTEPLACDGQQHDIRRSFDTSPDWLEVIPVIEGPGTQAVWAVAVTTD